ncbi:MAG TPA: maleylpyruvate isomerase family mycothiol-dependent enzyme [Trebonia sp.]|nr:maleylpyruvate isomerase family mycothiol-dependent enzyme [Trebonia sp.]
MAFDHEWFIDGAVAEIGRLSWIADGADPALPVPGCPGWTMAKLVKHTGTVHRWVTAMVAARSASRVDQRSLDLGLPAKESDYAGWLAAGAEPLAAALRAAGPDAAVWALGPDHTAGWWARRMLHETMMHRADAEVATGTAPEFGPDAAADGIDEFLANLPMGRRTPEALNSFPAGASLHLHATDCDGEWLIRFGSNGVDWERGHSKATTAARGPVAALLLIVHGRIPPSDGRLTVFGDESLLTEWQDKTAL